jgi:tRNA pseudouridine38-40 synthase
MTTESGGHGRVLKLTIAYDGGDFHGWQIQPGQPTVQGAITEVLQQLTQQTLIVYGAGRTDAGVHAWGQVAHFEMQSTFAAADLQRALNALLPPSIRIREIAEVSPSFHARWGAQSKTYVYRIYRGAAVPPFIWRYVLHEPHALDFSAMAQAARCFEGKHDFSSFAASSGDDEIDRERTMVRDISRSQLICAPSDGMPGLTGNPARARVSDEQIEANEFASGGHAADAISRTHQTCGPDASAEGVEWVYVVSGRSFLRSMVRKIVGTLLDVGRGRMAVGDITNLFEARDPSQSGPTAPAHGLCLQAVEYPQGDHVTAQSQRPACGE